VGAAFVDGFDSASRENEGDSPFQLWHVNALFLEIGVLPNRPSGIKLGSTGSVGVTSTHLGTPFIYWANS